MAEYLLTRRQIIPADIDTVFDFFESPRNLEAITPPWLNFKVEAHTDERVRLGTEIEYVLKLYGVPMGWRSRISEYERGVLFADEMLRGPYKRWYHRHLFKEIEEGVEVVDVVNYVLPFGPLGAAVHATFVKQQLARIFDYRREATAQLFGVPTIETTT